MGDSLQSGSCERRNDHKVEELNMGTDMKAEVYHKVVEEELKFFHMRMSSQ